MKTNERPTPETFAALVDHMPEGEQAWSHHYLQLSSFARRLERERDEARARIAELEKQLAEFQKPKVQDTFEAHGLTWIKHVPGDPRPCDRETEVRVLYDREKAGDYWHVLDQARVWNWSSEWEDDCQIIGWNYADAP